MRTELLPAFDAAQARISGVPQRAGLFRFTARVTDADGRNDTRSFELLILLLGDQTLQFNTPGLPSGIIGQPYRATIAASGEVAACSDMVSVIASTSVSPAMPATT